MPLQPIPQSRFAQFNMSRRQGLTLLGASLLGGTATAQTGTPWATIEGKARGQKVFMNAWGGSDRTNAYLQWAAGEVNRRYGVQMEHVKLTDTVEAVKRVRSEKAAGKLTGGSADVMWINGENFLTMKRESLLFGPFAESLPSYQYVDVVGKPTTRSDFSEPVDGMEAPWGMAQFTLYADRKRVPNPPRSMAALADFARANPGRVTYPRPPAFIGTTFLKQALLELNTDRSALYKPFTPDALARASAPLWAYLDALHPHLWRAGKQFPQTPAAIRQMMADGELMVTLTFNRSQAPSRKCLCLADGGRLGRQHALSGDPFQHRGGRRRAGAHQLHAVARGAGAQGGHFCVGRPHRVGHGQAACGLARPVWSQAAGGPGGKPGTGDPGTARQLGGPAGA